MRTTSLLLALAFLSLVAYSQDATITKEKWHWGNSLKQDTSAGYVQVIKVDNVLYISGAVSISLDPDGIAKVYKALEASLKSFGATFQNVVKENLYTTDIEAVKRNNAARKKFYNGDYPAATWVQIDRLFMESAKLEVELIAHLPKE
ncbi:MAG TPA: RidA family protein [Chryseosolibacter sp.]|nr:RidA family protein [Chryseosolibacter sp.]